MEIKNKNLHLGWIIVVLILGIILLGAVILSKWNLRSELNAAVSLSSILLAVISIIYAFVGNESLNRTLSGIPESTKTLTDAANAIDNNVANLSTNLSAALTRLDQVHLQVTATHGRLSEISAHISTGQNLPVAAAQIALPAAASAGIKNAGVDLADFYVRSSVAGIGMLEALHLGKERNKECNIVEIARLVRDRLEADGDYELGFLTASSCAGVLSYRKIKPFVFQATDVKRPPGYSFKALLETSEYFNNKNLFPTDDRKNSEIARLMKAVDEAMT